MRDDDIIPKLVTVSMILDGSVLLRINSQIVSSFQLSNTIVMRA